MNFLQILKEAISSINANKARSVLTILGIVIGVGAVIALMGIGSGAQATITSEIESIGTNVIYIIPGNFADEVRNPKRLSLNDVSELQNRVRGPNILRVTPVLNGNTQVNQGGESLNVSVFGVQTGYGDILNLEMAEGSFLNDNQVDSYASVIVIGPELAERLIGKSNGVVGEILRVNGYPFRVIGVTEAKGGSQFNNPDMNMYMPITSMQLRVRRGGASDSIDYILVQAKDSESVDAAIRETNAIMRSAHRLSPRQENDFTITNQEDFLSIAGSITSILTIFLSGIAGISLLVGGIGIMNIMLVSVTERTQEIGLRKALGARKFDIKLQFLTESALLSLFGGLIGIGLGWLLSALVGVVAQRLGTPLQPVISINAILLATLFSMAVGIFFGWYPANRAADLEPVEALRHE